MYVEKITFNDSEAEEASSRLEGFKRYTTSQEQVKPHQINQVESKKAIVNELC